MDTLEVLRKQLLPNDSVLNVLSKIRIFNNEETSWNMVQAFNYGKIVGKQLEREKHRQK